MALMKKKIQYIDLFCGIGGFRLAMDQAATALGLAAKCVFSCDIDLECQKAYAANFGERPHGDIKSINADSIPYHDVLLAGFPCQPFSIIGNRRGFSDTRGTLFFDIARILEAKKPSIFVLENVKLLKNHNRGATFSRILDVLKELEYFVDYRILNALDFGLPQKRERIFIVGFRNRRFFSWPQGGESMKSLKDILEPFVDPKFYASEHIKRSRLKKHTKTIEPTIWHENKYGHVSAYPFSCALRAGASYNYLLVNGERRLTPREMLRLQGFPDTFKIVCSDHQTRKQAGNALPVPVAKRIIQEALIAEFSSASAGEMEYKHSIENTGQLTLFGKRKSYGTNAKATDCREVHSTLPTQ